MSRGGGGAGGVRDSDYDRHGHETAKFDRREGRLGEGRQTGRSSTGKGPEGGEWSPREIEVERRRHLAPKFGFQFALRCSGGLLFSSLPLERAWCRERTMAPMQAKLANGRRDVPPQIPPGQI